MSQTIKDPGARIDYALDWGAAYLAGQAIIASSWTVDAVEAGGVTIVGQAFDTARSSVTLAGGREGVSYRITNRVTLSDGQIDERSIAVRVEQR